MKCKVGVDMHTYAIFSARYAPLTGGVEVYTQNIAHTLVEKGNQVHIITCNLNDLETHEVQEDGVEVWRVPSRSLLDGRLPIDIDNSEAKKIYSHLKDVGIDRVVVNTRFYKHSLVGVKFADTIGAPCLVIEHGSAHLTLGNSFADKVIEKYEHRVTDKLQKYDFKLAGVSSAAVSWASHFDIDSSLIVPNAIDAIAFKANMSDRDFRDEFGIKEDQTLVVSVGRLCPEKGMDKLAYAARLMPKVKFIVAGAGSLQQEIEDMKLKNFNLVGNLDRSDVCALLDQADVFCMPTRSEGFSTALLEACVMGCIPVMTHVGGVDEIMGDPVKWGVVIDSDVAFEISEGIYKAISLSKTSMGDEMSKDIALRCSWDESVNCLENAFDSFSS